MRSATPQTCRSLCFPQKEKPLTRYLAWSLAPTTTLSSLLIQRTGCRVRAVLRRFQPKQAAVVSDEKCATYPDLIVNLTNYSVTYMGKQVDMPPKELELLYFLASSPNRVFTRAASGPHLGLRIYWRYQNCRRSH